MAPVTAYDLAVWVFGVSHVDLQTRNLAQHIKDWDYLNKIAGYKANSWPEWLDIEAKAIIRAGHWSGGHGQAALFLAADALRPTLARAIALGARFS